MTTVSKIIHIDMDAFFASVEQRDNPDLKGKPVAVGGDSKRGVVAAASYEARAFGVFSAMSSIIAASKCPELIFVKPRFSVYKEVSNEIRAIFHEYTDLVEPLSLDEAYLDVTQNKQNMPSATLIAKEIKEKIKAKTGLIASAGISYNKFLAKMASDLDKPDGLAVILPDQADKFIANLPINKFYGIGKKTAEKMRRFGIHFGADLQKWSKPDLVKRFGKMGNYYFEIAQGIDDRKVDPNRIRKSISTEDTFETDLFRKEDMLPEIKKMCDTVANSLSRHLRNGKTITLKVKFQDFRQITRSRTLTDFTNDSNKIYEVCRDLLSVTDLEGKGVRLLGVGVSNFSKEEKPNHLGTQLTLKF